MARAVPAVSRLFYRRFTTEHQWEGPLPPNHVLYWVESCAESTSPNISYRVACRQVVSNDRDALQHLFRVSDQRVLMARLHQRSRVCLLLGAVCCRHCGQWKTAVAAARHVVSCARCRTCGRNIDVRRRDEHVLECPGPRALPPQPEPPHRELVRIYGEDETFAANVLNVYHADFEAFPSLVTNSFTVYATCLRRQNDHPDQCFLSYGVSALDEFLDELLVLPSGVLWFYNGSRFDCYLLLQSALRRPRHAFEVSDLCVRGSRLIAFSLRAPSRRPGWCLKVRDLFLFLMCSLARACQDYQVPAEYRKREFDHLLIRDWETVERYRAEVEPYLRCDVLAQEYIYGQLCEQYAHAFRLCMVRFLTISHLSSAVWSSTLPSPWQRLLEIPTVEEDRLFRRALFGGRVQPQVMSWRSRDEGVRDYLFYGDVVSLYPSAMQKNEYPCGPFSELVEPLPDGLVRELQAHLTTHGEHSSLLKRCFLEVDVDCPRQLITPFLMSRDETSGELQMDLHPKRRALYTGVELGHAVRALGYRVERIYRVWLFAELRPLFRSFIDRAYEMKRAARSGSAQYSAAKIVLNSGYGKHAQRAFETETRIMVPDPRTPLSEEELQRVRSVQELLDDRGQLVAYLVEVEREEVKPTQCVHLACFILSYSRIIMSNILLAVDGYRNPRRAFFYQDTDSGFFRAECLPSLEAAGLLGERLGDFKDELAGGRVVRLVCLAPKTYAYEYIKAGDERRQRWTVVRAKGIPHRRDAFLAHEEEEEERQGGEWLEGRRHVELVRRYYEGGSQGDFPPSPHLPPVDMSLRVYEIIVDGGRERLYKRFLSCDLFERLLQRSIEIVVYFGSFRVSVPSHMSSEALTVAPVHLSRTVNHVSWWARGKRHFEGAGEDDEDAVDGNEEGSISYPPGYVHQRDNNNVSRV